MEGDKEILPAIRTTSLAATDESVFRTLSRTFIGRPRYGGEDSDSTETQVEEWRLAQIVKGFHLNDPAEGRKLGVTWKDLTVKVIPSGAQLQENALSQFNILQLFKDGHRKPALKTILDSSFGCVKPGEMLLVLGMSQPPFRHHRYLCRQGRPGSGCTTLLKMLANKRKG